MEAWYHPSIARMTPNRRVTWQATSDDENFLATLGGAAVVWPLAARAQQPAMPMIAFFHSASPGGYAFYVTTFRNGLKEAGYIEGRNVAVECPRAEGQLKEGGSPCNIETAHLRWW
jgi:hypothetical protein